MKIEDCTKRYKLNREHQIMLHKLMRYKDQWRFDWHMQQLNTLQQWLQGDKFIGEVRIPQFTFEGSDKSIRMEIEFLYGDQCNKFIFRKEDYITIWNSLVDTPDPFGVADYNQPNFIRNNDIGEKDWTIGYVDLEGIQDCTKEHRQRDFFRGCLDFVKFQEDHMSTGLEVEIKI